MTRYMTRHEKSRLTNEFAASPCPDSSNTLQVEQTVTKVIVHGVPGNQPNEGGRKKNYNVRCSQADAFNAIETLKEGTRRARG